MRCPSRMHMTHSQNIPARLRSEIEAAVLSLHRRSFALGEEGADAFGQVEEIGGQAWRVWVGPAPLGVRQGSEPPLVALQTTTVYQVEVLRTLGRRQYDFGLLRALEVVATRSLQMQVDLDEQFDHLLARYSLGWGGRSLFSPHLYAEVAPSALAGTRYFSPEDRLWTLRSLGNPGGATVGRPEALVLLSGRQLSLASHWTVFIDQVFARQQQELQRVLNLGMARLPRELGGKRAHITAFGPIDARTLATIEPRAARGWQIEVQVLPTWAAGASPPQAGAQWGEDDLVVLVLQRRGRGGFSTISFRPSGLDLVKQAMAAHAQRGDA